jgi:hypothetical protein
VATVEHDAAERGSGAKVSQSGVERGGIWPGIIIEDEEEVGSGVGGSAIEASDTDIGREADEINMWPVESDMIG